MSNGKYDVYVSEHALDQVRELIRIAANGSDPLAHQSDGWLKNQIAAAVGAEEAKKLPKDTYPPIDGGEHDFVATLERNDTLGIVTPIKLIVVTDEYHDNSRWAVCTAMDEKRYEDRKRLRKNREIMAVKNVSLTTNQSYVVVESGREVAGFKSREDTIKHIVDRIVNGGASVQSIALFSRIPFQLSITIGETT